jgi:RimJ/RimL family protein N-acetyltransferase
VGHAASDLARYYNDRHNAALLGNTVVFTPDDVIALYADTLSEGQRSFLLLRDGELLGDADFRHFQGGSAEMAILVGPPSAKRIGLGTAFAIMLLSVAFGPFALTRLYASIRESNLASQALFRRLGFERDESTEALSRRDDEGDVCMSMGRSAWSDLLAQEAVLSIKVSPRTIR